MKRFNKEIKIENDTHFNIKLGTTNKIKPIVFYINGSAWIKPIDESGYEEKTENILYNFKKEIIEILSLNKNLSKKFIINFEAKFNAMKKNKKSYFSFELYLRQSDTFVYKNISDIKNNNGHIINNIVVSLQNNFINNHFEFI